MFTLEQVVPWGRSFEEYRRMFALNDADLRLRILGCADGPASFNAEATRRGTRVVSADPLYRCETRAVRDRIAATYEEILDRTRRSAHAKHKSPRKLMEAAFSRAYGIACECGRLRRERRGAIQGDQNPASFLIAPPGNRWALRTREA